MRSSTMMALALSLLGCGRSALFGLEPGSPRQAAECPTGALEAADRITLEIDASGGEALALAGLEGVVYIDPSTTGFRGNLNHLELETGRVTRLADGEVELLAAGRRSVLFAVPRAGERQTFALHEGSKVELGTAAESLLRGGPGRNIDGDYLGLCTSQWSLGFYNLKEHQKYDVLAQGGPCFEPVFTEGLDLVYLRPERGIDQDQVVHWRGSDDPVLPSVIKQGRALASPVLFRGRLFVISDGAVYAVRLDGSGAAQEIHPGPCSALDASAEGVILACGAPMNVRPLPQRLFFFDGEALRELPTDARYILRPRLGRGFVAWLAYETNIDLCNGGRNAGEVLVAKLDGTSPLAVAQVNLGCRCCGAYWPEPSLSVGDDVVVFNYDAASDAVREVKIGALRLRNRCE